ncbi:rod shape-determining protein, partial [Lactobacillus crispatus]
IVVSRSLRAAGDKLNSDIANYVRNKHNLIIGERTAEKVKMEIGSVLKGHRDEIFSVRGRNVVDGLPKTITMTSDETEEAMHDTM